MSPTNREIIKEVEEGQSSVIPSRANRMKPVPEKNFIRKNIYKAVFGDNIPKALKLKE